MSYSTPSRQHKTTLTQRVANRTLSHIQGARMSYVQGKLKIAGRRRRSGGAKRRCNDSGHY